MKQPLLVRYSPAFRLQVVDEIESGRRSLMEATRHYGIGSYHTVEQWIKKLGKNHLIRKVVRVETIDDRDRYKELQAEKKRLESALAQSQLKVMALEELIKVAEDEYKIDIKKNSGRE
jgi:transposase